MTVTPEVSPSSPGEVPGRPESSDSRRALRLARRRRRLLGAVCVCLVVLCLALTVLILDLARNRAGSLAGRAAIPVEALAATVHGPADRSISSRPVRAPEAVHESRGGSR